MPELDTMRLAALHKGVRFELHTPRDAIALLLIMVRDGVCSVTDAMECFRFDATSSASAEGK